jgi:hypothetical protein
LHLHQARVARGEAREQDAPPPPTLHEASLDGSMYVCKYACKADNTDAHGDFLARATEPSQVRRGRRPRPARARSRARFGCDAARAPAR